MRRAAWYVLLEERERERQAVMAEAAATVGRLTPRELELVAVTAYWCEGSKSKPWRRRERLTFINSDPDLIACFLAWLRAQGVSDDQLRLRLSIHESADVEGSEKYWAAAVGLSRAAFGKPTLKRHNPVTVRNNVGADYHGCLVVDVSRSRLLYQRVTGVWRGIAQALEGGDAADWAAQSAVG